MEGLEECICHSSKNSVCFDCLEYLRGGVEHKCGLCERVMVEVESHVATTEPATQTLYVKESDDEILSGNYMLCVIGPADDITIEDGKLYADGKYIGQTLPFIMVSEKERNGDEQTETTTDSNAHREVKEKEKKQNKK